MNLQTYLSNKIPFGEAASFFIEFKKLGADMGGELPPPPVAAAPEGQPAPGPDQILQLMAAVVESEFKSLLAYTVYAQSLRDLSHISLADEFMEHADEELEHAEFVLRRMAVLGGPVQLPAIQPPTPSTDPVEIIHALIQIEEEGIAAWQALHGVLGEDPTKYKVEEYLTVEQHHLDELQQLLPAAPAAPEVAMPDAAMGAPLGAPTMAPQAPAAPPKPPQEEDEAGGASVKVDLKPGGSKPKAPPATPPGEKVAFAEILLPGTEGYYSDRMLSVLKGLPAKVFTPEGALDGVKTAGPLSSMALPAVAGGTVGLLGGANHDRPMEGALRGAGGAGLGSLAGGTLGTYGGGAVGGLLGGGVAHLLGHSPEAGAGLGAGAGAALGNIAGTIGGGIYGYRAAMKGIDRPQKSASPPTDVDEKKAAFKQAAEELLGPDPRTTAYLQNEESGLAEEEQNAAEFYKQRFQEAQAQLDQVGQMHQQTQDQAAQLQQQVEQNQMALTSAQSQAQQATSMAMQQVMQAGDDKIQQQMQAAQMRMAFQQLRGQLMDIASQEPPPAALNDPMGQAQGAGTTIDPVSGQPVQGQDPAAAGVSQPQPADATASGATPAPQESETQATPAAPDAPKPAEKEDKGGTSVTVKHGAFMQHALGAGIGAALGGAGTALESSRHGDGLREGLRNRVAKLEQEEGSFPQALRLVASKGLLQMSEAAKEHPVGATIMGSLMGAGMGAATEPAIRSLVDSGKRLMG